MIKQGFQWVILFIAELFANVKCFSFNIKPSSELDNVTYLSN